MAFEPARCLCGVVLVQDFISLRHSEDKPAVRIAVATICPRCKKILGVSMVENYRGKAQLFQVEQLYRATRLNLFSVEEIRTGKVSGFNIPAGYNPDAFHESKGQEE